MKKLIYLVALICVSAFNINAQTTGIRQKPTITSFTVNVKETKISLNWTTDGSVATNYWEVQRSQDGIQFTTIALVLGSDPKQSGDAYKFFERISDCKAPVVYYRLRHIDTLGNEMISDTVKVIK
jgi:hypothetical protein